MFFLFVCAKHRKRDDSRKWCQIVVGVKLSCTHTCVPHPSARTHASHSWSQIRHPFDASLNTLALHSYSCTTHTQKHKHHDHGRCQPHCKAIHNKSWPSMIGFIEWARSNIYMIAMSSIHIQCFLRSAIYVTPNGAHRLLAYDKCALRVYVLACDFYNTYCDLFQNITRLGLRDKNNDEISLHAHLPTQHNTTFTQLPRPDILH